MEFFNRVGKLALGSRLRMLTERITDDAAQIYKLYNIELQPKWFPVFYVLSQGENKTITAIAKEIGHSHPSVSKIITEMSDKGYVTERKDKADGRTNIVSLSPKGKTITEKIAVQYTDVNNAIEEILAQTRHDLWQAIEEWEFLLEQKNLLRRVHEQKKKRESRKVKIVDYQPKYQKAFRDLNEEWISKYFKMEEADYKALDNPKGYILKNGGHIYVALYDDVPVGVCALIKMDDPVYDFELAKMAVSPRAQGKNIGYLLGQAVIKKAKSLGASKLYLESNTILVPAINLYHKLGFQKVVGHATPYERCNIQMELTLK
ncbi:bifunctional helix-turn-helix transcriptional regulator/GNAT family N-acetyltransferase [Ohtaekwangia koreensis]|uniref:Transcriptional regulator, MarR family with acetyltransferase activity n=1 Tax=Ohtaekwangia koreensis TaxID=688867 RepID=A0A1T5JTC9_9BACT|nr:bifunctional helix-turn-helix transcriptional regulator/GNAT family N-acetyltransferase [Ohtaekwangia koreensis]SKC54509.1 transcriptional regulator, MarR family with acetyltransferase activity [Ohtaekwangia koreensis]